MCFSAEASFVASGVLAGTGIAISRLPRQKSSVPLVLMPAIFATHQLIEGFIWLKQDDPEADVLVSMSALAYALIAYILWPVFIPFAVSRMEPLKGRRLEMMVCQVIGLAVGLVYLTAIIKNPVGVSVESCSLTYSVDAPGFLLLPYLAAVSIPFLLSSHKGLVLFGLAVITTCVTAYYFSTIPTFPSVWCFFAAFLSASLYVFFRAEARMAVKENDFSTPNPVAG